MCVVVVVVLQILCVSQPQPPWEVRRWERLWKLVFSLSHFWTVSPAYPCLCPSHLENFNFVSTLPIDTSFIKVTPEICPCCRHSGLYQPKLHWLQTTEDISHSRVISCANTDAGTYPNTLRTGSCPITCTLSGLFVSLLPSLSYRTHLFFIFLGFFCVFLFLILFLPKWPLCLHPIALFKILEYFSFINKKPLTFVDCIITL